jgi:hypothetical protein
MARKVRPTQFLPAIEKLFRSALKEPFDADLAIKLTRDSWRELSLMFA